jgi:hypothetical protein
MKNNRSNNKSNTTKASEKNDRIRVLKSPAQVGLGIVLGVVLGVIVCVLFLPSIHTLGTLLSPSIVVPHDNPNMSLVSTFENGQQYKAGPYNVVVVSGTFPEMGRQYGDLMKPELNAIYQIIINEGERKGYTVEELRNASHSPIELLPERLKTFIRGEAETSGLTYDDLAIIYYGAYFYDSLPDSSQPTGCSFLAVSENYTKDGTMIVSRNFDLPDVDAVFDPYYTLTVYRPDSGNNEFATISPAGMRSETLMNNKRLFISDNNGMASGGVDVRGNRPDFISEFYRFMLDCSSMRELDDDIQATRPNTAIIVNAAGPDVAYSYEETLTSGGAVSNLIRRSGDDGLLVATNHFIDPLWKNYKPQTTSSQFSNTWITNSELRYSNLVNQATQNKGTIDVQKMLEIRDVMIDNGGATVQHADFGGVPFSTDLQVVFVPQSEVLWMKVANGTWQNANLGTLFAS